MAVTTDQVDQRAFEDAVRSAARVLWIDAALDGALKVDGRERDGVFETRDSIHVVEATVSMRKEKAGDDAKKTHDLVLKLRRSSEKTAQGWVITRFDPTADQKEAVRKYSSIRIMGFEQFRGMLFRGSEYLTSRDKYRFGSIMDFSGGTVHVPENEYVPVDFTNFDRTERIDHREIISPTKDNRRILILGEFGSGKSMSLRAAFAERRRQYSRGEILRVPVYLNLRDHSGQSSPVEALERHARLVGYPGSANDLVRVWRAGYIDLILDGFDEMATAGWGGSIQRVRQHRFAGMTLARNFVLESPNQIDIYIAGRENFFDSATEMRAALGTISGFRVVRTSEFSAQELTTFLKKKNLLGQIPKWLSARPLLISYLAAEGLLGDVNEAGLDEARGWDSLLNMIAEREASQDKRLDPDTVRRVIERLATLARSTADGLGNLDVATIHAVFQDIALIAPDEAAQQFLLRLPGLAPSSREDGSRVFVDPSIADAAKAGDIFRFVQHPYGEAVSAFEGVASPIGSLGKSVLSAKCNDSGIKAGQIERALQIASATESAQVCSEILFSFMYSDANAEISEPISIRGILDDEIYFNSECAKIKMVSFYDCLLSSVVIEDDFPLDNLPEMHDCLIGQLQGILGSSNLPKSFHNVEVSEYADEIRTNADVFDAEGLSAPVKVLVSILRKLFLQSGAGRQEAAFYRGNIDGRARKIVPEVLAKVASHGFAEPTRIRGITIWHPNRSRQREARYIISSPTDKSVDLLHAVSEL